MSCIPIPTSASTPFILGKSRMRKCARSDLCGGDQQMVVPTATLEIPPVVRRCGKLGRGTSIRYKPDISLSLLVTADVTAVTC